MENQYLMRWIPERASMRSKSGTERKNSSYSSGVQKPMTCSHTGAVVPAAIKAHDFTGARQVLHVALKVPLGAFPIIGCRVAPRRGRRAD